MKPENLFYIDLRNLLFAIGNDFKLIVSIRLIAASVC